MMKSDKIIAIVGPTASGKTAAALALAKHYPIEIISMDSALVYRGMDIGTAKPTVEERQGVPHHLIDVIEPHESYSVAQFIQDSTQCIRDIQNRGKLPIIVGGTMMYLNALLKGMDDLPTADAAIRATLDAEIAEQGIQKMYSQLEAVDPMTAARLKPTDTQRIQRALEIYRQTGTPMSTLIAKQRASEKLAPQFQYHLISLEPNDRSALHERIALRFDKMLNEGFLEEVASLHKHPLLHANLPSIRSVGYRQAWDYLNGECDYATMREKGIIATRQLAKRQLTWLRPISERVVLPCDEPHTFERALKSISACFL